MRDDMLPPLPDPLWSTTPTIPPAPQRRWPRTVAVATASVVGTLMVLAAVLSQISVPWVAFEPGTATSAETRVSVTGASSFTTNGDILFLTVRVNRLSMLEMLVKGRDRTIDMVSERDYFGTSTPQESRAQAQDMMVRAKSNAELVALSSLGYQAFVNSGVRIESVASDAAANGKVQQFEVITAVDGTATPTPTDLIANLAAHKAGDTVTFAVEKGDGSDQHEVTVTLGARPDGKAGGFLGVTTSQFVSEAKDLPVTVKIDSGNVGGNSAGLAFTLAVIDELTDGSLTGGQRVAVTGTIDLDGNVGEVGGVPQKAVAARRAGAKYFLVPRALEAQAKINAGDMVVVPVSNLAEAIAALNAIGGNGDSLNLTGPAKAK